MVDAAVGVKLKFRKSQSRFGEDTLDFPTLERPHAADGCDEKKPRSLPFSKRNWEAYMKAGPRAEVFWVGVTLATFLIAANESFSFQQRNAENLRLIAKGPRRIVFEDVSSLVKGASSISERMNLLEEIEKSGFERPDVGGLIFDHFSEMEIDENFEKYRRRFLRSIDDDIKTRYYPLADKEDIIRKCREASWVADNYPSCNQVHELTIERLFGHALGQDFNITYLNSGAYRDAWRFQRPGTDHLVLKRMQLDYEFDYYDLYKIHNEANFLELLSPSPRILDIYGFCGGSTLVEAMASDLHHKIIPTHGKPPQKELDKLQKNDVKPMNAFTTSEKLQIALEMAESLADLHGFEGGTIYHADTHIEQWLIAFDGSIKLNDFNNAKEPLWDEEKSEYCLRYSGYGGVWRSPEEFRESSQDESVDTYAFSNNIYTLLTGLWPFYADEAEGTSHKLMRKWIVDGKRPFVDPRYRTRSYIEGKLVEIMERCWVDDRRKRPPIFEVVDFLREVKLNATKIGELQPSRVIKIT